MYNRQWKYRDTGWTEQKTRWKFPWLRILEAIVDGICMILSGFRIK